MYVDVLVFEVGSGRLMHLCAWGGVDLWECAIVGAK